MAIAFDALSSGNGNGGSLSVAHTVAGSDRALVVCIANLTDNTDPVSGDVSYNGTAMTKISETTIGVSRWVGLFLLIAPSTGANNVTATLTGTSNWSVISASYTGVKQTGNPEDFDTNSDGTAGTTFTISNTSVTNNAWHVACFQASGAIGAGSSTTKRGEQGGWSGSVLSGIFDTNAAISPAGANTLNFTCNNSARSSIGLILAPSTSVSTINVSETSTLSESVTRGITKIFQDSSTVSEVVSVARLVIISIVETISWVESFIARLLWTRRTKPTTPWDGRTEPTTAWDDRTKPTTTWTPRTPPS